MYWVDPAWIMSLYSWNWKFILVIGQVAYHADQWIFWLRFRRQWSTHLSNNVEWWRQSFLNHNSCQISSSGHRNKRFSPISLFYPNFNDIPLNHYKKFFQCINWIVHYAYNWAMNPNNNEIIVYFIIVIDSSTFSSNLMEKWWNSLKIPPKLWEIWRIFRAKTYEHI